MSVDLREECSCAASIQVAGEIGFDAAISVLSEWRLEHRHGEPRPGSVDQAGSVAEQAPGSGEPTLGFRGAT